MHQNYFKDKAVLLLGGTGSVGEIIVKNLLDQGAAKITIIARDETKHQDILDSFDINEEVIESVIGDIRDINSLREYYKNKDVVIHAAAMKHVKYCERFKEQAYKTNIEGLDNSLRLSVASNIDDFIFISSDKAADPTTYYGKTKRDGEKLVEEYSLSYSKRYVSIRLGNVLGARNSILPRIKRRIDLNLPIETSCDTRFIMSQDDVFQLLSYSIQNKDLGAVFVKSMDSVKVEDLVKTFIKCYNSKFSLVKNGAYQSMSSEKRHELLFGDQEKKRVITNKGFYVLTDSPQECTFKNSSGAKPFIDKTKLNSDISNLVKKGL